MSFGSSSPGGSPEGIGGNESGIGASRGGNSDGSDFDSQWGLLDDGWGITSEAASNPAGYGDSPYGGSDVFGDYSATGSKIGSTLGGIIGGTFLGLPGATLGSYGLGQLGSWIGSNFGSTTANAPTQSSAGLGTKALQNALSPYGKHIAQNLTYSATGMNPLTSLGALGYAGIGALAGYGTSKLSNSIANQAAQSIANGPSGYGGTNSSGQGGTMADIDWGGLGSAAIGLGASYLANKNSKNAQQDAYDDFLKQSQSNAAQENAWNRDNALWTMMAQQGINQEDRQWKLDQNQNILNESRDWQLSNNERLGKEYRDWNTQNNRDITNENQQRQMDMLGQNRPNQYSDYGSVEWTTDANGNPVQKSSLDPQLKQQLDVLRGKYGEMVGGLDSGGFGVNNDVMNAIRGLQESGLSRNEEAQRARYAAMGIPLQSTAMDRGEQNLSRTRTDADLQAILAGNTAWQQGQANTRDNLQSMAGLETTWNKNLGSMPQFNTGMAAQQSGFTANAPTAQNSMPYTASSQVGTVPSYASASLGNTALDATNMANVAGQAAGQGWNQVGQAGIDIWKSLFPGGE